MVVVMAVAMAAMVMVPMAIRAMAAGAVIRVVTVVPRTAMLLPHLQLRLPLQQTSKSA
jgi:hypothetical protein